MKGQNDFVVVYKYRIYKCLNSGKSLISLTNVSCLLPKLFDSRTFHYRILMPKTTTNHPFLTQYGKNKGKFFSPIAGTKILLFPIENPENFNTSLIVSLISSIICNCTQVKFSICRSWYIGFNKDIFAKCFRGQLITARI